MATSVSFGSKGTWERLLSIPSSVLLQKLIPSCLPTQRTPYVATRMLLLHGSLETRSSQSIERRRPVAHTKCNMRIFDSCRHTTKRNFSNLLLDGSISTSPACASPPMNYYSWRIIEGHTHTVDLFPHISLKDDRQKFGHSLSPHLGDRIPVHRHGPTSISWFIFCRRQFGRKIN